MQKQTFEIVANNLAEAKRKAKSKRPKGPSLFSEHIVSDGAPKIIEGVADSIEQAYENAQKQGPLDAEITNKKVLFPPSRQIFTVEAFDEQEARSQAKGRTTGTMILKGVSLKTRGKKGFLKIGRTPNIYEVQVFQRAVVGVTYKEKAKIRVTIVTELPSHGYCQLCGRSHSPLKLSAKSAHFFCSSDCEDKYWRKDLFSTLLGGSMVITGPGVDRYKVMQMQAEAEALEKHCWFCGRRIPMRSSSKCRHCGKDHEIQI